MRLFLLSFLVLCACATVAAQSKPVNNLPAGRYEAALPEGAKWERGDIILIDDSKYKISTDQEVGEYRFSTAAQRIFFTSGPLQAVFARAVNQSGKPAIALPHSENSRHKLAVADVVAVLKQ